MWRGQTLGKLGDNEQRLTIFPRNQGWALTAFPLESPDPPKRQGYLAEVASAVRGYHQRTRKSVKRSDSFNLEAAAKQMGSRQCSSADDLEAQLSRLDLLRRREH